MTATSNNAPIKFAGSMGGQLLVESGPGRGSAFTLVLPDAVNQ
jgi:signal transduction histidine kinase